ncbi:LOW QUALITY PROTEIN: reverse transcriptase [Phytophthora megakarya]|uniref:Reverse transcriptase n=1 Tax=Phytophthora megakarya TaxID=4795 RepID=A0A225X0N1_9STRA|nr:LOW QUALITY PROTEIN: reverse transcriptase [Phytophthora megakarya]
MSKWDYLGHGMSEDGLGAKSNNLDALATLKFPRTLNYYHRFIPDFAIYATALYSLTARDFEERILNPEPRDLKKLTPERAIHALQSKSATTPLLKHLDVDKQQCRTLKPNELNYSIAEKEIVTLLRMLNECHNMLVGRTIRVLTRHTTLWSSRTTFSTDCNPLAVEIIDSLIRKKGVRVLSALTASITLRGGYRAAKLPGKDGPNPVSEDRTVLWTTSLRQMRGRSIQRHRVETADIERPASGYAEGFAVNEAEHRGMLLGISLLDGFNISRLVISGASNLVVQIPLRLLNSAL